MRDKEKQQIFTLKKLQPAKLSKYLATNFLLISELINQQNVAALVISSN